MSPALKGKRLEGRTCTLDEGEQYYNFKSNVMEKIRALGISEPPRPKIEKVHEPIFPGKKAGDYFDGRLPTVIRRLSIDQLSFLHSLFTNWFAYVSFQAEVVAVEKSEARRKKDFTQAWLRDIHKYDSKTMEKRTAQEAADSAKYDERYVKADAHMGELDAVDKVMQAVVSMAEQDLKTISREITIQQVKLESDSSKRSYPQKRIPPEDRSVRGSFRGIRKAVSDD